MNTFLRFVGYILLGIGIVLSTTYTILNGIDPEVVNKAPSVFDTGVAMFCIVAGALALAVSGND